MSKIITRLYRGLSPRVRGNPPLYCAALERKRSIPACTGEPSAFLERQWSPRVYPRVYGGTSIKDMVYTSCRGLSPRVRGNPRGKGIRAFPERSIPACTGEPMGRGPTRGGCEVYPRVYGGTVWRYRVAWLIGGLSPRVRGNPIKTGRISPLNRSIPACTGEPDDYWCKMDRIEVYPRVYGGT